MLDTNATGLTIDAPPPELAQVRGDFPMLSRTMHGEPLAYLDSAATSLKPKAVIDALSRYYTEEYGTVRRGNYLLSQEATARFEATREKCRAFVNAERVEEIIFLRGVTEAINLVATSFARGFLQPGDEILISAMEHHANIVPWQLSCEQTGAVLKVAPIDDDGVLLLEDFKRLLSGRTKVVAINHVANSLGTINPVKEICRLAHEHGAVVLIDGAQSAVHLPIDVQDVGCDFYAVSGHKMLAPTGAGFLYGRYDLLKEMPPYQGGGEMIETVDYAGTTYDDPPYRFEAGTPPIAPVLGLGHAIDYLNHVGLDVIRAWDEVLVAYATSRLQEIPGLRMIGTAPEKSGVCSFVIDGIHAFDLGTILDRAGVAIRVGHHCAQPVMRRFGVDATARASFALYNNRHDIDQFIEGITLAREMLE